MKEFLSVVFTPPCVKRTFFFEVFSLKKVNEVFFEETQVNEVFFSLKKNRLTNKDRLPEHRLTDLGMRMMFLSRPFAHVTFSDENGG